MLITLVGNNTMYKMTLPDNAEGDYWITDKSGKEELKLVNIKSYKGNWIIVSNKYSKILNERCIKVQEEGIQIVASNNTVVKGACLNIHSKYYISVRNSDDIYALFCSPSYEKNVTSYKFQNSNEIVIGSAVDNDIVIKNGLVCRVPYAYI